MSQGNFAEAMSILDKLTRSYPGMAQLWFDYGCACLGAGQLELAERFWKRAQDLEPASSDLPLPNGTPVPRIIGTGTKPAPPLNWPLQKNQTP